MYPYSHGHETLSQLHLVLFGMPFLVSLSEYFSHNIESNLIDFLSEQRRTTFSAIYVQCPQNPNLRIYSTHSTRFSAVIVTFETNKQDLYVDCARYIVDYNDGGVSAMRLFTNFTILYYTTGNQKMSNVNQD